MIERAEYVPREDATGLPYNVAPAPDRILVRGEPGVTVHHSNFSDQHGFVEERGLFGSELRVSRIELTEVDTHNRDFKTYELPTDRQISLHPLFSYSRVPKSPIGQARMILAGGLKAVTPMVLDFYGGSIRRITDAERQRLFTSGEVGVQSMPMVLNALIGFTLHERLAKAEAKRILDEGDCNRGSIDSMLDALIPSAFNQIQSRYRIAWRKGMFPPGTPDTSAEAAKMLIKSSAGRFHIVKKHATIISGRAQDIANTVHS